MLAANQDQRPCERRQLAAIDLRVEGRDVVDEPRRARLREHAGQRRRVQHGRLMPGAREQPFHAGAVARTQHRAVGTTTLAPIAPAREHEPGAALRCARSQRGCDSARAIAHEHESAGAALLQHLRERVTPCVPARNRKQRLRVFDAVAVTRWIDGEHPDRVRQLAAKREHRSAEPRSRVEQRRKPNQRVGAGPSFETRASASRRSRG